MANNIQGYEKIVNIETTDCFEELERIRTFIEGDSLWELYVNNFFFAILIAAMMNTMALKFVCLITKILT